MSHLKIKIRIKGSKKQKFKTFIIIPKNKRIQGKIKEKIGFWDTRNNHNVKYIVFNVYNYLFNYINKGLNLNKKVIYQLYYYFNSNKKYGYLTQNNLKLLIENEFKKNNIR